MNAIPGCQVKPLKVINCPKWVSLSRIPQICNEWDVHDRRVYEANYCRLFCMWLTIVRVARHEPAQHESRACKAQVASCNMRVCKSECKVRVSVSQQNQSSVSASQHYWLVWLTLLRYFELQWLAPCTLTYMLTPYWLITCNSQARASHYSSPLLEQDS